MAGPEDGIQANLQQATDAAAGSGGLAGPAGNRFIGIAAGEDGKELVQAEQDVPAVAR